MNVRLLWGLAALVAVTAALLAPLPAQAAGEAAEHVIRPGDNLHLIAGYFYRDPRQWRRIRKLNRKAITDASHLVPGRVLQVELEPGLAWDIPYEEFLSRVRGR